MSSYYFWFFLLSVLVYFVATDDSVARAINLISRLIQFEYEKIKWWIIHNPANPIVRWIIWRRSMKMAKELEKEFFDNLE